MAIGMTIFAFLAGAGVFLSYVFYKPVPEGFPNPWRYRIVTTLYQVFTTITRLKMCVRDRRCPNAFEELMESVKQIKIPEPTETVPGSNIRSHVTLFDGVKVRVYAPLERKGRDTLPAFIYFHGGGLATGSIDMYNAGVRMIAERLDAVGIAVEYRLAPDHTHPAAFDDSMTATKWFLKYADRYGVDPRRVAVMGDSAGGLLCAAISGAVSDDPTLPDIKLQVMIYPWLQSFDMNTPSMQKFRGNPDKFGHMFPLDKLMAYFTTAYVFGNSDDELSRQIGANNHTTADFKQSDFYCNRLNHDIIPNSMKPDWYVPPRNDYGSEDLWGRMKDAMTSPKFSPLYREDFSKFPRAFIGTCGYDAVRDDGIFYAKALETDGVPVKWVNYENAYHGIPWVEGRAFEIGKQMANDFLNYTKEHL